MDSWSLMFLIYDDGVHTGQPNLSTAEWPPTYGRNYTYSPSYLAQASEGLWNSTFNCYGGLGVGFDVFAEATLPPHLFPPSPDDPSRYVSGQTAWWSLVPLAIASMTQPCGEVLGRKDKNFRFYSRASPIVCTLDVLQFVACLALALSFTSKTTLRNIEFELRKRFSNHGDGEGRESRSDAERTRVLRWALLIIGGVPCQTIKVAVMGGIFWTKVWAISYFGSIVFWELMSVVAQSVQTNHGIHLEGPRWRCEHSWVSRLKNVMAQIPLACHFYAVFSAAATLFYWAIFSLSDLRFHHALAITVSLTGLFAFVPVFAQLLRGRPLLSDLSVALQTLTFMVLAEVITAQHIFATTLFSNKLDNWDCFRRNLESYLRHERTPPKDSFADILIPWTEMALGIRSETMGYLAFLSFEVIIATILSLGVPRIFDLLTLRRLFKVDTKAGSDAAFIFISTFLFSLLWYCFVYQPVGTYLPDWADVLS